MNQSSMAVNLSFTADTSQAKQQIMDLQNSLTKLASAPTSSLGTGLAEDINKASIAAAELKTHLTNATNVKTGSLDFSKLNQSITKSGKSLSDYANQLNRLGPEGKQAFMQLANAVSQSEIPIRRSNKLLNEMALTFKNTVKWQLSSSMLHGFMGALQSAYGYAKDLNASLNDIRIVTGYNIDKMTRFAEQANKAAKALSTTTTDYTNASLIYFQQGLNEQQVKERTDITMKMANVSRQSAEIVSDQMTAVWNNFDNGSKSLEYYADVMTALGAATASSTEEIAQGLEKFAAVSETVGLSYEYATAALATVTSETRQSADVVGTAFKTMFARIQGLELGETLEDGTNLNQYSEALMAVGVNIKTANGDLKDMDQILREMAGVWETLNRDEQVALAQKVAGVRQYNQLVSLMESWDVMEQNLGVVSTSSGALQEQADIYAESWEAASDRVRAASEDIWDSLINDEFFIDILNGFEDFLTLIGNVVDNLGGMKGVLLAVSTILLKTFSSQMSAGIANMATSMSLLTEKGREAQAAERSKFIKDAAATMAGTGADTATPETDRIASKGYEEQLKLQDQLAQNVDNMSEVEISTAQQLLQARQKQLDLVIQMAKEADAAKNEQSNAIMDMRTQAQFDEQHTTKGFQKQKNKFTTAQTGMANVDMGLEEINTSPSEESLKNFIAVLRDTEKALGSVGQHTENFENNLKEISNALDSGDVTKAVEAAETAAVGVKKSLTKASNQAKEALGGFKIEEKTIDAVGQACQNTTKKTAMLTKGKKQLGDQTLRTSVSISQARGALTQWSDIVVRVSGSISSLAMSFSMVKSTLDTFSNPDATGWEKFSSVLMTTGMVIPSVMSAISGLRKAYSDLALTQGVLSSVTEALMAKETASTAISTLKNTLTKAGVSELTKENAQKLIQIATTKTLTEAEKQELLVKELGIAEDQAGIVLTQTKIALQAKSVLGKAAEIASSIASAIAEKVHSSSILGVAASYVVAQAAQAPMLVGLLAIIAAITAFVAIAAIAVMWIKSMVDAYNSASIAADKANKSLSEQKKNLEEIKTKYEELKDALDSFSEAEKTLDKMTRGTDEWKEAVQKLNKQVVDLITLYPELAKYVIKDEDGVLGFETGAIDTVKDKADAAVADAEVSTYGKQITANAANDAEKTDTLAKQGKDMNIILQSIGQSVAEWTAVGGMMGTIIGAGISSGLTAPIGMLSGAIVGLGEGIFNGLEASKEHYTNEINSLIEAYQEGGEDVLALEETQAKLDELAKALGTTTDALLERIRQGADVQDTNRLLLEQKASTIASQTSDKYDSSKYRNVIDKKIADQMEADSETVTVEKKNVFDSVENQEDFLKLKYGAEADQYRFADTGGGDVTLEKKNADGGWSSVDDKRNERDKKEINEEYEQLRKDKAVSDNAKNFDVDAEIKKMEGYEKKALKAGLSGDGAVALATAKGSDEKVNLAEMSEADMSIISEAFKNNNKTLLDQIGNAITQQDIEDYNAKGGSLGARNAEFSEMYQAVNNPAEGSDKDALAEMKKTVDDANAYYQQLSEEDKRIFAETVDFKVATNKEMMEQMFLDEKQARADAMLDTAAETHDLDSGVLKAQAGQIQAKLEKQDGFDEDAVENVEEYGDALKKTNLQMEDAAELAAEMAVRNQRMNKGVDKLTDSWDDWKKTLKSSDKTTQDYAEALDGVGDCVKDILGMTEDELIPADFLAKDETIDLLDEIADGSEEAVEKLGYELTKAQIESQELTGEIAENLAGMFPKLDSSELSSKFDNIKNAALTAVNEMQSAFAGLDPGQGLSGDKAQNWANALNQYAMATGMSVEAMQSMLSKLQVKADVTVEEKKVISKVPKVKKSRRIKNQKYNEENQLVSYDMYETASTVGYTEAPEVIQVAQINTKEPVTFTKVDAGTITPSVTTGGKDSGSGSGGGGDSKPSKKTPTKKKDLVDAYKEVNDALESISRTLDKVNKKADIFYGPKRIENLAKANELLQQENDLLDDKMDIAKTQLKYDKTTLANFSEKEFGIRASFDNKTKTITNSVDLMEAAYNKLIAAEKEYNSFKNADAQKEYEEKTLKPLEEKVKELEELIAAYDEDAQAYFDAEEQKEDNKYQIESNKTIAIQHVVETKIDGADLQLDLIDFQLEELENQGWDAAKAMDLFNLKTEQYIEKAGAYEEGIQNLIEKNMDATEKALWEAGKANEIDWSSWTEEDLDALKEYSSELLNVSRDIADTRAEIEEALITSFEDWSEGFRETLDDYDHFETVISSYKNIMDLTGRRGGITDEQRKNQNNLLVDNANEKLAAYKTYYDEVLARQAEIEGNAEEGTGLAAAKDRLAKAEADNDENAIAAAKKDVKAWEEALKVVLEEAQAAEADYLASWEGALQAQQDAFIANAKIELEALEREMADGYGTLEEMQKALDRNIETKERYLDDYEKLYELNKLNRNLEKELNNIDNVAAKEKLLKIQEKINQYQAEGVEMSKYDLEYLQKEYDLELAKIAMEEARNAKSQVRMTRDAEGNYSYTYTADEEKSDAAAQNYEDKLYEMTNFNNEYAQESSSKIISAQQEMLDELNAIHEKAAQGMYETDDEYRKALAETQQYYTSMLTYYGAEVDKATLNNTVTYAKEYQAYSAYVDQSLSQTERLKAQQEAAIIEAEANVQKLQIQQEAANSHLEYLYQSGQISKEQYWQNKVQIAETYSQQVIDTSIESEDTIQRALSAMYEQNLITQDEYEERSMQSTVNFNVTVAATTKEAIDAETAVLDLKYQKGVIKLDEYLNELHNINDKYSTMSLDALQQAKTNEEDLVLEKYNQGKISKQEYRDEMLAINQKYHDSIYGALLDAKVKEQEALKTQYENGEITFEQYQQGMAAIDKRYNTEEWERRQADRQAKIDFLTEQYNNGKISEEEFRQGLADIDAEYNQYALDDLDAAKTDQENLMWEKYQNGKISEEEFCDNMKDINLDYNAGMQAQIENAKQTEEDYINGKYEDNEISKEEHDKRMQDMQKAYDSDNEESWKTRTQTVADETAAQQDSEEGLWTSFREMLPKIGKDHTKASDYVGTMVETIGSPGDSKGNGKSGYLGQAMTNYQNFEQGLEKTMNNAGTSTAGFSNHINNTMPKIQNRIKSTTNTVNGLKNSFSNFTNYVKGLSNWQTSFSNSLQTIINKSITAASKVTSLQKAIANMTNHTFHTTQIIKIKTETEKPKNTPSTTPEEKNTTLAAEAAQIIQGVHYGNIPRDKKTDKWTTTAKNMGYSDKAIELALKAINDSKAGQGYSYYYQKALELVGSYDTGGYTGEWGSNGKLALLHEKELVLNAQDTENMLNAISMIRDVVKLIDLQAYQAQMAQLSSYPNYITSNSANNGIEQHIEIHAEFPDATNHREIEEAFDNLMNLASQYVNRK